MPGSLSPAWPPIQSDENANKPNDTSRLVKPVFRKDKAMRKRATAAVRNTNTLGGKWDLIFIRAEIRLVWFRKFVARRLGYSDSLRV